MSKETIIDKLVILKRVTGFAAQGIIASPKYIGVAENYLGDLMRDSEAQGMPMDLSRAKVAIDALKMSVMPSTEICLQGMVEVDGYLRPLRQVRRQAEAAANQAPSAERPRMN